MKDILVRCANRKCGLISKESEWVFLPSGENISQGHCPRCHHNSYYKAKPAEREKSKTGAQLIDLERHRQQVVEGYSAQHDDAHPSREIACAAKAYLDHYVARAHAFTNEFALPGIKDGPRAYRSEKAPDAWPWEKRFWKPQNPLRDLIRAGALIAAEIDRLQRKESAESAKSAE